MCRFVINRDFDGDVLAFVNEVVVKEGLQGVLAKWPALWGTQQALEAWTWFTVFGLIQALMQLFVPGKDFDGPPSPKGNVPRYKVTRRLLVSMPLSVKMLPHLLSCKLGHLKVLCCQRLGELLARCSHGVLPGTERAAEQSCCRAVAAIHSGGECGLPRATALLVLQRGKQRDYERASECVRSEFLAGAMLACVTSLTPYCSPGVTSE